MASNNEMFERGVHDAERDDLNTFYYQHYYHYRQGYDKARRRLRREPAPGVKRSGILTRLIGFVIAVAFIGAAVLFLLNRNGTNLLSVSEAGRATVIAALPTGVPSPTRRARTPTPELPAATTVLTGTLRPQAFATVMNLSGNPLRMRAGPSTNEKVVARLPEGTLVQILEGPVEADGYAWWKVQTPKVSGWAAERSPEGAVWLVPK
ncbi:MAG: SH3 domain-containing protein [Chloroflexales bacterium]|nr:SH3 domain-containing protein [Chloroflexales bacterium]